MKAESVKHTGIRSAAYVKLFLFRNATVQRNSD